MSQNDTSRLRLSVNQWRTTVLKACIGANVPRGTAEDLAEGATALLSHGIDPLPVLLPCLQVFDPVAPSLNWPGETQAVDLGPVTVLHHGPSLVDMAQAGHTIACRIDAPELLLGMAMWRGHTLQLPFQFAVNDDDWQDAADSADLSSTDGTIRLRLNPSPASTLPSALGDASPLQPQRSDFQKLQKFADEILVPADDSNRADAGAGLTDND